MPLLADITGNTPSVPVGDPDLVMLDVLCRVRSSNDMITPIRDESVFQQFFAHLQTAQIEQRLGQYQGAGVLVDHVEHPPTFSDVQPIRQHASSEQTPEKLRLSTHFALCLAEEGLCAWSANRECFVLLSPLEAIAVLAFADGKSRAEVMQQKGPLIANLDIEGLMASAFALGLLASEKELIETAEPVLTPFTSSTPSGLGLPVRWQDVEVDDRIPIYFVPHMENHLPLALGVLYSAISAYQDGTLLSRFTLIPINYLSPQQILEGPYRKFGPGVWLFSNYMWSIDVNMQISQAVKQHNFANFTVHGGPSTPDYAQACQDFMFENPSVDVAVHGEGEITITDLLEQVQRNEQGKIVVDSHDLSQVNGITYRDGLTRNVLRTGSRERMKSPDMIPSPYLDGVFDGYQGRVEAAIIETNRGCPYGCTFCDWGSATNQKIRKFDLDRVKDEIDWIGRNQIRVLWIADANYGLYDRDIEISKYIVETKEKYGYPQEIVVNYTKNSTWRLVEIIKVFSEGGIIGQGIISIQTTDENTLDVINRKNIRTQRYDELAQAFTDLNLPLSTDLMIGLPGMTVESFTADLQRYIDMDVSVKAYPTQLLPNSPMAEPSYMEKYQIQADEHNYLTSTYSYTESDLSRMKALHEIYVMADGYGLLRYTMRYLQWEYGISAGQLMSDLLDDMVLINRQFPAVAWALRFFNQDKSMPSGWERFYAQFKAYLQQKYDLADSSGLNTVLKVNRYAMPDDALQYPKSVPLEHDFVSYFHQAHDVRKPLQEFGPTTMQFSDPNKLASIDLDAAQYDSHQYFWELHSAVARPKSIADFAA